MADETQEVPVEEEGKKKKGGLVLIIVTVVLIVGGVGGGFFMGSKSRTNVPEGRKLTDKPVVFEINDLYVNIAETKATRVLKITPILELSEEKLGTDIEVYRPIIRDLISEAASRMTIDELEGRNGRAILKREIKDRINVLLRERMSGAVVDVYFSDFLIQ